ncbi:MAG: Rpn family recombination-promoting nuclease/putative transposase, partial [Planctomycetota bacterium]|nr:Rpn family recombination-promoting nuclease/putative transposase [Planctomycetota bacterium]
MVQRRRIRNLVRNFKENGVKMMLEHSQNVRETLEIVSRDWAARVDFSQLVQDKTTYVRRDFRHVESDMVFQVPLLGRDGRRLRKKLVLYILIEHQSQPEPLMPLRLTDYMLQIFNHQLRQWAKTHNSLTGVRLSPVLPLVLYTGTRRWKSVGSLTDLIDAGHDFRSVTPIIEQPLFLNLPTLDDASLAEGGAFGMVL